MLKPNRSLFFENRSLFFESRTLCLSKIGVCFLKIGVCFYRKSEFVFWQAEYAFIENRSLFFENRSLFFWKSAFDFWKSEFVFFENRSLFFENPSIGPRFWAAILLLSSNKISGGSREGAGEPAPPSPLFLDQTEARRAEKKLFGDHPPPYLRVWMTPPPLPLIWRSLFQFSLTYENKRPLRFI